MKKIRIMATVLALTMIFGSSISAYAVSYQSAWQSAMLKTQQVNGLRGYSSNEEKTRIQNGEVAAGDYYDAALISSFVSSGSAFTQKVGLAVRNLPGGTKEENGRTVIDWNGSAASGDITSEIETDLNSLDTAYNNLLASKVTSDGSKYSSGESKSESKEESAKEAPSKPKAEIEEEERQAKIDEEIQAYQEKMVAIDNNINKSVTQAVEKVNTLVASGNQTEANATKAQGVKIDLTDTNVHSFGLDTYDMLDKATVAGVPTTMDFKFGGQIYRVTIPAGKKASDLCFPYNTKGMILLSRDKFATEEQYLAHLAEYNKNLVSNRAEYDAINAQRKAAGQPLLPKPYCGFLNLTANYGFTIVK